MIGEDGRNIIRGGVRTVRGPQQVGILSLLYISSILTPLCAQTEAPPRALPTVDQSIFRSRWTGPQFDQPTPTPAPTPEAGPEATPAAEGIMTPAPTPAAPPMPQAWDSSLGDGFYLGAINIIPTLAVGWEYTDENNTGTSSNPGSNNSFFITPGLVLIYEREVGAWTVSAKYGAAYQYYFDDNYKANGGQGNSNTIQQTLSLSATVQGSRYRITGVVAGYTGSGFDTESGQNNDQTGLSADLTAFYQLSEWLSLLSSVHYDQQSNSNANTAPDSDIYNLYANVLLNQSWTSKTAFLYQVGAGRESQSVETDPNASQRYVQALVGLTHTPNDKVSFTLSGGGRYIDQPEGNVQRDEGLQPAYIASITYRPTDKTSLHLGSSLERTDVEPNYNFDATWTPRETTSLQLSIYQTQGYSSTFGSQIRIQRGVSLSLSQTLFTNVSSTLSGGYEQQDYDKTSDEFSGSSQPADYVFGSLQLIWQIRHWLAFQTGLWLRDQTDGGNTTADESVRTHVTISLQATF